MKGQKTEENIAQRKVKSQRHQDGAHVPASTLQAVKVSDFIGYCACLMYLAIMLIEQAAIVSLFYFKRYFLLKPWLRKFPYSALSYWYWKDVILEPH